MSETADQTVLAKLAALETELASLRKEKAAPTQPRGIDPAVFARDPYGTMEKHGIPAEHVTKVLVAKALGDQAPQELRTYAATGNLAASQVTQQAELEALRRRLDQAERASNQERAKSIAADKTKYPHLSRALASDPDLIQDEIARGGGTPEEAATAAEARLARTAKALGASAAPTDSEKSEQTAVTATAQQATTNTAHHAGDPPPLPRTDVRGFGDEERRRLRDEIVRKHDSGYYDRSRRP
jgi:hypothetical protein